MPIISPTLPNDGETIDAQDVNVPFNAILSVLNGNIDGTNISAGSLPWSVMDSFSNQIPASAMRDSGNLEKFRADGKISFIQSGLIWSATTGLNAGMTLGNYYANSGILLPITAITSRTFTASRDTYVSIGQTGTMGYSEVTNGAAQPSLPSNANWLAKVVTSGSAVTSVVDMRQLAPIASHNVDLTTLPAFVFPSIVSGKEVPVGRIEVSAGVFRTLYFMRWNFTIGSTITQAIDPTYPAGAPTQIVMATAQFALGGFLPWATTAGNFVRWSVDSTNTRMIIVKDASGSWSGSGASLNLWYYKDQ